MTRFTIPGPALTQAVAWANRLIPSRPTAPPLAGIMLTAEKGQLRLSVFDFETAGQAVLDAEVEEPGTVLVSGRLLAAVTKTLGAKDIAELGQVQGDAPMTLSIGRKQGWELPTLDLDYYPQLPAAPPAIVEVDADGLADAIGRVLPAIGDDPTIPGISGGYVSAEEGGPLILAGTDRYRLAVAEIDRTGVGSQRAAVDELLVPAGLLGHVQAAARESGGLVRLLADHSRFGLAGERRTVSGALFDDSLPWRGIRAPYLTETIATRVLVETAVLRSAVDRASVMLGDGESLVCELSADGIDIRPAIGGRGRATHTAPVESYEGEPRHTGIKGDFLRAALDSIGAPAVEIQMLDRDWRQIRFLPADADGTVRDGFQHLVAQQRQAAAKAAA